MENTSFNVFFEEKTQDYGRLYLEPLERGYGDTLGNALRRLLLSSIRGAAVVAVKIDGVLHEFSTIPGIREDVIEILMNLKHIPIRAKAKQDNNGAFKIITLDSDDLPDFFTRAENPGVITARDLDRLWDNEFEFCGDGILCTLEPGAHLIMEIYIAQGVGYLSAERERPTQPQLPVDALLTDAIFSPVKRVNYQIEPARVGQSIDYERLLLEVWTNGAISPEQAVSEAAAIAKDCFGRIFNTVVNAPQKTRPQPVIEQPVVDAPVDRPEPAKITLNPDDPLLKKSVKDLGLSIRSENCLLRGEIKLVGDLLSKSHNDLLKIHNLGKKSLTEIEEKIEELRSELIPAETFAGIADNAKEGLSSDKASDVLLTEILQDTETALANDASGKNTSSSGRGQKGKVPAENVSIKEKETKPKKPKAEKSKQEAPKEEAKAEAVATEEVKIEVPVEDVSIKEKKAKPKKPKAEKPKQEETAEQAQEAAPKTEELEVKAEKPAPKKAKTKKAK